MVKKVLKKDFFTFVLVVLITVVLTRVLVLIVKEKSIFVLGFEIHHFYLGVLLLMLAGFSRFFSRSKKLNKIDLVGFGIGNGLILDELNFILFTNANHVDYFSRISMLGGLVLLIIFVFVYYFIFIQETKK